MRRSASEIIRNLEMRVAKLEKQSAKEKTLFERASKSEKKKVHEILLDAMLENTILDRNPSENHESSRYGHNYEATITLTYKVSLHPICKVLSRLFRQEVSRDDLQPFLNDFYPEEMNLEGKLDDLKDSEFYDISELSNELYHDEYLYDDSTSMWTEVEIEDVDGDYLIANAYVNIFNSYENF